MAKTNHQTGYHKPVKNPTTNYGPDSHKKFCERCYEHNAGCIITGKKIKSDSCSV